VKPDLSLPNCEHQLMKRDMQLKKPAKISIVLIASLDLLKQSAGQWPTPDA
jgi:hypothetical protein